MKNMALDFEEMRRIYRLEKSTARLVDVPPDFFVQLHGLIEEERKKYFDSLKDLNTTRARDFGNLKKLVDEWFVVREKKLLNTVLMAARLEEMDNQHMAVEEKVMAGHVYNALMLHRLMTKHVLEANGEFISMIAPEKNSAELKHKEKENELEKKDVQHVEKIVQTIPPSSVSISSPSSPADVSLVVRPIKILSDIPSFVGTDLKEYGPYKPGQVIDLPEKIAQLFISRKLGE